MPAPSSRHIEPLLPSGSAVGLTLNTPYLVGGSVGKTLTLPYGIGGTVGKELAQPYTIITTAGLTLTVPYVIQGGAVGKSLHMPYSLGGTAGLTLTTPYILGGTVGKTLTLPYSVIATDPVGLTLQQPYLINLAAGQALTQPYFVLAAAGRTLRQWWTVRGGVTTWTEDYIANTGGRSTTPAPTAGVWRLLEYHYTTSGMSFYIDGTLISTANYTTPFPHPEADDGIDEIQVGQKWAESVSGSIAYIDSVKVGTSRHGTEVFSDDFSSGNLSAWSSTSGSVSVVSSPGFSGSGSGNALKADAGSAEAYASKTFSNQTDVWVELLVGWDSTALDAWGTAGYSGDFVGLLKSGTQFQGRFLEDTTVGASPDPQISWAYTGPGTFTLNTADEDTPISFTLNVQDPPGHVTITVTNDFPDGLLYSITPDIAGVIYNEDTEFTVTIHPDATTPAGTYHLTITATDDLGHTTQLFFTFVVEHVSSGGGGGGGGTPTPRLREAIDDIACITQSQTNGGLRHFTNGNGQAYTLFSAATGCGAIEHDGAAVFWWNDNHVDGGVTNKRTGVCRVVDGSVEYLGSPFWTGRDDISYLQEGGTTPIIDINDTGLRVVSDGSALYCVALVSVDLVVAAGAVGEVDTIIRRSNFNYPLRAYRLACTRWTGGTTWSDWGWSDHKSFNYGIYWTHPAVIEETEGGGSFYETWSPVSVGGSVEAASACASAAEPGIARGCWYEQGVPKDEYYVSEFYSTESGVLQREKHNYMGVTETREYFRSVAFTGPGRIDDARMIWSGQRTEFDGVPDTSPSYLYKTFRTISSAVMASDGGTPLLSYKVGTQVFLDGGTDPGSYNEFWTYQIINPATGDVLNTKYPAVAWGGQPVAQQPTGGELPGMPGIFTETGDPTVGGISWEKWIEHGYRWVTYQAVNGGSVYSPDLSAAKDAGFDPNVGVGVWGVAYGSEGDPITTKATSCHNMGVLLGQQAVALGAQHVIVDLELFYKFTEGVVIPSGPHIGKTCGQVMVDALRSGGWTGPVHLSTLGAPSNPKTASNPTGNDFGMDIAPFLATGGGVLPQAYSNETRAYDPIHCLEYWTFKGVPMNKLNYTIGLYSSYRGADYVPLLEEAGAGRNISIFLGHNASETDLLALDEFTLVAIDPISGTTTTTPYGNPPGELHWDPNSQLYYHLNYGYPFEGGALDRAATILRGVSLTPDGTTWDRLRRDGVDVHRVGWYDTLAPLGTPASIVECATSPHGHVYVYATQASGGNKYLYAWNPCPGPGPYTEKAWYTMYIGQLSDHYPWYPTFGNTSIAAITSSAGDRNYVPPIPNDHSTYSLEIAQGKAVKLGDTVYSICLEKGHTTSLGWDTTESHSEFRLYAFTLDELDNQSCPVLIGRDAYQGAHIWYRPPL